MIDKPPAEPSTMYTAMVKAKMITEKTGHKFAVLTADMQLYKVASTLHGRSKHSLATST